MRGDPGGFGRMFETNGSGLRRAAYPASYKRYLPSELGLSGNGSHLAGVQARLT